MTLAIIVARQDDFIIIADTRQEGNHPDYPNDSSKAIYHDQEQKVFHSATHRIGLCIANQASVKGGPNDPLIRVSYLLGEYFGYIDANTPQSAYDIGQLPINLLNYLQKHYPAYVSDFVANTSNDPTKGVNLLFGGFSQQGHTVIYTWFKDQTSSFEYVNDGRLQQQLCAFSNQAINGTDLIDFVANKLIQFYGSHLKQPPASLRLLSSFLKENQNEFLCASDFYGVFSLVLPYYRDCVHGEKKLETVIGEGFDCYKINNFFDSLPLKRYAFYLESTSNGPVLQLVNPPSSLTDYTQVKTVDDIDDERQSGAVRFYDQNHDPLVLQFAPNPP